MNVAVFGDLHGRILLAFWLVKRWQEEHGESIDHILCVGDVGIYPSFESMDKPSKRFALKYPEELGFSKFFLHKDVDADTLRFVPHPVVAEVFDDVTARLYFVAGNHEDHHFVCNLYQEYAVDARSPFAVDIDWQGLANGLYSINAFTGWGRVLWLPEGPVHPFYGLCDTGPEHSFTVRSLNGLDKYTMPQAWESPKPGSVDILLSHDVFHGRLKGCHPEAKHDDAGSKRLSDFIIRLAPSWHFFGHMHRKYPEQVTVSVSGTEIRSVGMNQLFFKDKAGVIDPGSFGVLKIPFGESSEDTMFSYVEDAWFTNLRYGEVERLLVG